MAIEENIATALNASTIITGLTSARIFVSRLPDLNKYPAILVTRIHGEPMNALSGYTSAEKTLMQIDCFAETYAGASQLSTIVHTVMDATTAFKNIQISNQDLSQPLDDLKDLFRMSADYSCWLTGT